METIDRAAIAFENEVYSVPRPGRHHDVARIMWSLGLGPDSVKEQGFVTSTGRFVNREEANAIAQAAGQILVKTSPKHVLFSEDVW